MDGGLATSVMVLARHLEGLLAIMRDVGKGWGCINRLLGNLFESLCPPPAPTAPLPILLLCLKQRWHTEWHGDALDGMGILLFAMVSSEWRVPSYPRSCP